jgi:hypothetical protein
MFSALRAAMPFSDARPHPLRQAPLYLPTLTPLNSDSKVSGPYPTAPDTLTVTRSVRA